MAEPEIITPDWPAPAAVKAAVTTRNGGASLPPYAGLNLASHVGDNPEHVAQNRALIKKIMGLPSEPLWLNQTHSDIVIHADDYTPNIEGDASYATKPGHVCAVLTADCLPILACNTQGSWVAAIHAGWQGIARGVIEAGIATYAGSKADLIVWLGPAIGSESFEVQRDVIDACTSHVTRAQKASITETCFTPVMLKNGYFLGYLYELGRLRLRACGVEKIFGGNFCTYKNSGRFFSYRRDGHGGTQRTGRMASLVWITP